MARITVEDSARLIANRFELVMVAAQRVRQILSGSEIKVERQSDKNTVVALREIAENHLDIPEIYDQLIKGKQLFVETDDFDEDIIDVMDMDSSAVWVGAEKSEGGVFADALDDELTDSADEGDALLAELMRGSVADEEEDASLAETREEDEDE